jgi:hypothetical protein
MISETGGPIITAVMAHKTPTLTHVRMLFGLTQEIYYSDFSRIYL